MVFTEGNSGISKDEAVEKLTDRGYQAFYDKGVVRIGLDPKNLKGSEKEIEAFLKEIDYRMSYGLFLPRKTGESPAGD